MKMLFVSGTGLWNFNMFKKSTENIDAQGTATLEKKKKWGFSSLKITRV